MATVWSNFNNGDTGAVVRNAINIFNAGTATDVVNLEGRATVNEGRLTVNEGEIDTAQADIIDHEARLVDLELTGLVVLTGNALAPQTIAVTPTKVITFDTKTIEAGVGATGDVALDRATATLSGVFKLRYEAFIKYASNVTITWQLYKNGVPFGNTLPMAGQGTTNFSLILLTSTSLLANDYIELYGTASASTSLTVAQANGTLEKTHF